MDLDEIRLAQDARFDRVGEYGTRKGMKALNTSILGLNAIGSVTSATTSIYSITEPYEYTATAAARICGFRFSAEVVGEAAEAGIPKFSLYINGELADVTCINPSDITRARRI